MADEPQPTKLVDMAELLALQAGDPLQLIQVAGPGAERTFRVLPLQEAILGRSESAEVCIDETSVSRQHARIEYVEKEPRLIDLGSTNGTYLNGEKIRNRQLAPGDRLQIGSSVFEVLIGKEPVPGKGSHSDDPDLKRRLSQIQDRLQSHIEISGRTLAQESLLAGNLKGIGLASLLQILQANLNSGSLVIRKGPNVGHVYLEEGNPVHAKLGRARGKKALFRLMAFSDGSFELLHPGFTPEDRTLNDSLQSMLLDAVKEIDEFREYRKDLPPDGAILFFSPNRTFFLDRVPPDLFEVLAAISRNGEISKIIDECSLPDLAVCRSLLMLFKEKILIAEAAGDTTQPVR